MSIPRKLDPRTKLALGIMGLAAVLMSGGWARLFWEFLVLCGALLAGKLFRRWVKSLRLILPVVALVFVISVVSFDIHTGAEMALRLLDLLTVSFLFFQTISADELGDSLRKMGIPYEFSFILTTSMRYVPLIGRRIRRIVEAQRSRGIDLRPRVKNIPRFLALLMPLLFQSFILAEQLAMAMEARGFSRKGRTLRNPGHISGLEYGLMIAGLALLAGFGVWARGG